MDTRQKIWVMFIDIHNLYQPLNSLFDIVNTLEIFHSLYKYIWNGKHVSVKIVNKGRFLSKQDTFLLQ